MTSSTTVTSLRNAVWEILSRPEMEEWEFYKEYVAREARIAAKKDDLDRMELIHWYFTDYWENTPESETTSLSSLLEALHYLRGSRSYKRAAHLFTVEAIRLTDSFAESVKNRPFGSDALSGYAEMANEIFVRPEAAPVMVHLICDRNISSWDRIAPMLDDLLSTDALSMTSGVL